jgi:hypothetical protein
MEIHSLADTSSGPVWTLRWKRRNASAEGVLDGLHERRWRCRDVPPEAASQATTAIDPFRDRAWAIPGSHSARTTETTKGEATAGGTFESMS